MTPRDQVIHAVEANVWAMHADFKRVPGAEVHDEADLLWFTVPTPSSWLNGASRPRLSRSGADAAIEMVMGTLHSKGRNVKWHLGPSMEPDDLASRLAAHDFTGEVFPGMARSLVGWSPPRKPHDLATDVVSDESSLLDWLAVFGAAFGAGGGSGGRDHWWFDPFRHLTLRRGGPCRLFIGRIDGQGVACSIGFLGAAAIGVYGVGTPPELRGRGYGSALTVAALEWGHARGADLAILHASELGEPVYHRLGFETVCEVSQWLLPAPSA